MTTNKSTNYVMTRSDDQEERSRLDLQHQIWLLSLNGDLHKTLLPAGLTSILDIGTGTGSWALAMARAWPNAEVVATDLTLPQIAGVPPNLTLRQHDADSHWPFEPGHFEFIHGRMLASGIHDWPGFLSKCWMYMAPGGKLELLDVCHPFRADDVPADSPEASPFIRFGHLAQKSWALGGLDYFATDKHVARLKDLGFKEVVEHVLRWPLGQWPERDHERRVGTFTLENFSKFMEAAGKSILTHHGFMTEQAADELVAAAKRDLQENCNSKRFYLIMLVNSLPSNWTHTPLSSKTDSGPGRFIQHTNQPVVQNCIEEKMPKPLRPLFYSYLIKIRAHVLADKIRDFIFLSTLL